MLSFLVPYCVRPDFLEEAHRLRLLEEVLQSPYLGATDLDHGFEGTRGFSMLLHRSQMSRLGRILPSAPPYLERMLDPRTTVLFVNPLVIQPGQGVAPHADKTLMSFLPPGTRVPFPRRVSVLYLAVPPDMRGGELVFHRNALIKARVRPRVNTLVDFAGWLDHEVTAWEGQADQPRVSLVCEQYRVGDALRARLPEFHLESTRSFAEFLAGNSSSCGEVSSSIEEVP